MWHDLANTSYFFQHVIISIYIKTTWDKYPPCSSHTTTALKSLLVDTGTQKLDIPVHQYMKNTCLFILFTETNKPVSIIDNIV